MLLTRVWVKVQVLVLVLLYVNVNAQVQVQVQYLLLEDTIPSPLQPSRSVHLMQRYSIALQNVVYQV